MRLRHPSTSRAGASRLLALALAMLSICAWTPAGLAAASASHPAASLSLGARGAAVRALQATLARLTYLPPSAVDGVFDLRTWHAVVAFQGWQGLVRDGVDGPRTRAALTHARSPVPWSTATGLEIHIPQQVLL